MLRVWTHTAVKSAEQVEQCVNTLTAHGLDPRRLLRANPSILGYASESISEKIEHLTTLGINPVHVLSVSPRLLSLAPVTVTRRTSLLTAHEIDAAKTISKSPNLLGVGEHTLRQRLTLFESTARAWGVQWADVVRIMERFPALLSYKTDRARAVIRVVTHAIPIRPTQPPTANQVSYIMIRPVKAVLMAYLYDMPKIRTHADLCRYTERHAQTDKARLRAILEAHRKDLASDPVLKFYWRAYPHAPGSHPQPDPEPTGHNTTSLRTAR